MPRKYEYIEHTADLGFKARGETLEELFVNAAEALFEVLVSAESVVPREKRSVEVKATDLDGLMVCWLNELLYIFEAEGLLLNRFQIQGIKVKGCRLHATVHGERIDPARHQIKTGIKAVTYHRLYVRERNGFWESQVILDL